MSLSPHQAGATLAEAWTEGSEVWTAQEELRKFLATVPADKRSGEKVGRENELRSALKAAQHASLMGHAVCGLLILRGTSDKKAPPSFEWMREIPAPIKRAMKEFDLSRNTMGDGDGIEFKCVEICPASEDCGEGSSGKRNGRPPEYLWMNFLDILLARWHERGVFPATITMLYAEFREAALKADPNSKNVMNGGPTASPIENFMHKQLPLFRKGFKEI
jgi:hypothetical protein